MGKRKTPIVGAYTLADFHLPRSNIIAKDFVGKLVVARGPNWGRLGRPYAGVIG